MGRQILLIFLIGVGIAIIIYTINNWDYINHTLAIAVIIANIIAVVWNLSILK